MAKGARQRGVEIVRKLQADAFHWTGTHWEVTCTKMVEQGRQPGGLGRADRHHRRTCGHSLAATMPSAPHKMLGIKMPAIPVEHTFIVMDTDPELVKWREAGNPGAPGGA